MCCCAFIARIFGCKGDEEEREPLLTPTTPSSASSTHHTAYTSQPPMSPTGSAGAISATIDEAGGSAIGGNDLREESMAQLALLRSASAKLDEGEIAVD